MPISPPRERERERSGRQHGSGASSVTSSVGERSVSDASVVNDSTAATAVELRQILISTNAEILAVQEHGGRPAKELTELVAIIEAALSATEAELAGEEEAAAAGATGALGSGCGQGCGYGCGCAALPTTHQGRTFGWVTPHSYRPWSPPRARPPHAAGARPPHHRPCRLCPPPTLRH
jgi:hypothetical protein